MNTLNNNGHATPGTLAPVVCCCRCIGMVCGCLGQVPRVHAAATCLASCGICFCGGPPPVCYNNKCGPWETPAGPMNWSATGRARPIDKPVVYGDLGAILGDVWPFKSPAPKPRLYVWTSIQSHFVLERTLRCLHTRIMRPPLEARLDIVPHLI